MKPTCLSAVITAAACILSEKAIAKVTFVCADEVSTPYNEIDIAAINGISAIMADHIKTIGDETSKLCRLPDGRGRFWHFENASIYWTAETGAHAVYEPFRAHWAKSGWEQGWLGYPQSSTINTFDNRGTTTNFQGGQLFLRPPAATITEVRTTDVKIDLPTPPGEAWRVIQANAKSPADSHRGPFTYCYDMVSEGGVTAGAKFVSTADARIAAVNDLHGQNGCILKDEGKNKNVNNCRSNYVSQKLGRGRYASSIHLRKGSYVSTFGGGKGGALSMVAADSPWEGRPIAKSGETIGLVGDSGAGAGNDHIHFCVTTSPDDSLYGPLESTPFVFRNYEKRVWTPNGQKWMKVKEGRPKAGDVVRRAAGYSGGAAEVKHLTGIHIVHGETVRGSVSLWPLNAPLAPGVVTLRAYSAWGEPMSAPVKIKVDGSLGANPVSYEIKGVPNYQNTVVRARYEPTAPAPRWARPFDAESLVFTPNDTPSNLIGIILKPASP